MWIFPQGRQRAAHVRPLGFKPGLRLVAARAARHGAVVVPVGLAYPWRESSSPSIALRFGEAIDPATTTRGDLTALVEQRVAALVDDIHAGVDADARVAPGRPLVPPTRSNTEDGVGARVLRRLLGGTR
jgi:1-acyl-sn-glycerol-3-phosphate acyltransferase